MAKNRKSFLLYLPGKKYQKGSNKQDDLPIINIFSFDPQHFCIKSKAFIDLKGMLSDFTEKDLIVSVCFSNIKKNKK